MNKYHFVILLIAVWIMLTGCAAEKHSPLAVERIQDPPPRQESLARTLDARGYLNDIFVPGNYRRSSFQGYPVTYTGNWHIRPSNYVATGWYTAHNKDQNARVDIVGTMSRVIFDFWDYELYDNPGVVSFYVDDNHQGTYDLKRKDAEGKKILSYQISTQKNTVATISMVVQSGRAMLTGYIFTYLDERFPY